MLQSDEALLISMMRIKVTRIIVEHGLCAPREQTEKENKANTHPLVEQYNVNK